MSNADLLRTFADLPAFEKYGDRMSEWISDQQALLDSGDPNASNWSTYDPNSGNPNPFLQGAPFINDLFNIMWTDPADVREFGTPNAPVGYASPLSPKGAASATGG